MPSIPLPAYVFLLLTALAIGSFLNVCISRLPRHMSVVAPASHCPRCQAPLRAVDNVPLLSWILLRGRCRSCHAPISLRYPLVEGSYAALALACFARFGLSLEAVAGCTFCFLTLGLLVMDLETMRLPDSFTLPGAALGLLAILPGSAPGPALIRVGTRLFEAAGWALVLLAIRWGYRAWRQQEGLGLGDVKLIVMLTIWLGGMGTALTFFLGVLAGALAGLLLASPLGRKRTQARRTTPLPFGTFLCAAALYTFFWGEPTLTWYFHFYR